MITHRWYFISNYLLLSLSLLIAHICSFAPSLLKLEEKQKASAGAVVYQNLHLIKIITVL